MDLNLAAAEHYLFARYLASLDGDINYRNAPKWYETFKSYTNQAGFIGRIQTSDQPTSPTNADVTRWGENGVEKGLSEYKSRTGSDPSKKIDSYIAALGIAAAIFYKSKSTEKCETAIAPLGKWESTDASKRWLLEFSDSQVIWTERSGTGTLVRTAKLSNMTSEPEFIRFQRNNDNETLAFLGISSEIRSQVLAKNPTPSWMLTKVSSGNLTARWFGLIVTKTSDGKFDQLRQPGTVPEKEYQFRKLQ